MSSTASKERVLDVRGTGCPYPQLKTKVELDKMAAGDTLRVLIDDRSTAENICTIAEQLEDSVLRFEERDDGFTVTIQKSNRSYKSALKMKLAK